MTARNEAADQLRTLVTELPDCDAAGAAEILLDKALAAEARRTIDVLRPFLTHADDCALPRQNYCDCGLDARLADEGVEM
jgi:hypothetical protein